MEINDKFEAIKTQNMNSKQEEEDSQKPTLVTLSNDSTSNSSNPSLTSSQTDLSQKLTHIEINRFNSKKLEPQLSRTTSSGYYSSPMSSTSTASSRYSYGNSFLYDEPTNSTTSIPKIQEDQGFKGCCLDCGAYTYLIRFNELQLCENCYQNQWENEINELMKMKNFLENGVIDLKKYLAAKKTQCNENIKNSHQIKKFINMTMQQIKRKVELELENKRDELFNSIDAFVENQKKINTSINEDTFQTSERICEQIENFLLNTENEINLFKLKSIKTYAKANLQRINQQRTSRIPIYSIFFVPDSNVQVANSFGKIVLKSYDPDSSDQTVLSEFNDLASFKESCLDDFAFLNPKPTANHHFDNTQSLKTRFSKWTSNDNVYDSVNLNEHRSLSSRLNDNSSMPKRNKSLFSRPSSNSKVYMDHAYNQGYFENKKNDKQKEEEPKRQEQIEEKPMVNESKPYVNQIYPVKLTLTRNSSLKADTLTNGLKRDEANKEQSTLKTTFKQQVLSHGPKLVNF
ncbi:unnamed protein product [Brachionus calyciflorus]|uniref:Uncharacterized protein n=1 Tax=Brachionus calyciflorus TaxID=104777 RepID=A0A813XGF3_9BILA|nr:unnamed protein product [Brachionus calyciflorus]